MEASQSTDPVALATTAILNAAQASVSLTAGGEPGADLPEVKFPRLSLTRRVLGFINDEVDETAFGPRNTLAAVTRGLITDPHTVRPQNPEVEALDVSGSLEDTVRVVFEHLGRLVDAGLVDEADGVYSVTEAGRRELDS